MLKEAHKFDRSNVLTRLNSAMTKISAIQNLYNEGARNIGLITCPGPAKDLEDIEHEVILAMFKDLSLQVQYFELEPIIAETYNISYGDLFQGISMLKAQRAFDDCDGLFVEWDGTSVHETNLTEGDPSVRSKGLWAYAMNILNEFRDVPLTFSYTHCSRAKRNSRWRVPTYENPLRGDWSFSNHWATYLTEEVSKGTDCNAKLVFSTRDYWRQQLVMKGERIAGPGAPCYRWVWRLW